jgi:hypothetical protein
VASAATAAAQSHRARFTGCLLDRPGRSPAMIGQGDAAGYDKIRSCRPRWIEQPLLHLSGRYNLNGRRG